VGEYGQPPRRPTGTAQHEDDSSWTNVLRSPIAKTIVTEVTRG